MVEGISELNVNFVVRVMFVYIVRVSAAVLYNLETVLPSTLTTLI